MTSLDKIIKPRTGISGAPFRPHDFLPIEETVSGVGNTLSDTACESFKRGFANQGQRCPTLSGMEEMLSNRSPDDQQAASDSNGLEPGNPDSAQNQLSVACILERFSEAVKDLEEKRNTIYERAAKETVKLALAISEKVINHEVSVNPDVVLSIVRKAMQKIKNSHTICIRLHPDDLIALKQADLETSYLEKTFEGFAFQPDGAMGRGDCLIETLQGDIDAGIRNQLAFIEEAFVSLVKEQGEVTSES